ncbi:MAG TPA: 3'-5' exoribonuclease [Reyranellaceae bacterium]|nr:3'-5' exoribonuclease [Reyranellaceae bacterium]
MTRIWFDTEFIEDGKTIDLLSIGMVREDGLTYYAEIAEADRSKANDWVKANVLPHLTGTPLPRERVARAIVEFAGESPEFWGYYADYDWVALCQLYGTMMQLPKGWPMYCRDLKQAVDLAGNPKLPENKGTAHDAMDDALWTKAAWEWLLARETALAKR